MAHKFLGCICYDSTSCSCATVCAVALAGKNKLVVRGLVLDLHVANGKAHLVMQCTREAAQSCNLNDHSSYSGACTSEAHLFIGSCPCVSRTEVMHCCR